MSRTNINASGAALWASAIVVAALVIIQAGKLPGNEAHARMTSDKDDFVLLTSPTGRRGGDEDFELLYIIDNRNGMLLVYEIEDTRQGQITPRQGMDLNTLFRTARQ